MQSNPGSWSSPERTLWECTVETAGSDEERNHLNLYLLSAGGITEVLVLNNSDTHSSLMICKDAFVSSLRPKGFLATGLCCFLLAE